MLKNNNRVFITGANRGIGFGLTEQYLSNGYSVVTTCKSVQKMSASFLNKWAEQLIVLELDIASETSIKRCIDELKASNFIFDIVINNAGITIAEKFGDWSYEAFSRSLLVNSVGPAIIIQGLKSQLADNAKVINISSGLASISDIQDGQDLYTSYAMSKAAINMLNMQLSKALPSSTVVALNPGWVRTDMGGPNATDSVENACAKIIDVIGAFSKEDSGRFVDYNGCSIPY